MSEIFPVILAACLINNLVLENLLGVSAVRAVSRTLDAAHGMSKFMLLVLPVTTTACYFVHFYVLVPAQLEFLRIPVFVLFILLSMYLLKIALQKLRPSVLDVLGAYFPLMLVNASALGIALLAIDASAGLLLSLLSSIGTALGFGFVLLIFSAVRARLAQADTPGAFDGIAVELITLGILAMAFMGFAGLQV